MNMEERLGYLDTLIETIGDAEERIGELVAEHGNDDTETEIAYRWLDVTSKAVERLLDIREECLE